MKKIAIITISWGTNYGNRLQNYAMQETYKKYGFEVETIKFFPDIKKEINKKYSVRNFLKKVLNKINVYKKNIIKKRNKSFEDFNKMIQFTETFREANYKEIPQNYDYYSVGSDQVWNSTFPDYSDYYLLDFIKSNNKIAYAPSIGTDEIPKENQASFKKALSTFKALSCREEQGAQKLAILLNRKVEVLVDPTLLITQLEWNKIIKKPKKHKEQKYILCYFLGKLPKKHKKAINDFARENHYKIINLLKPINKYYGTGPSEFLYLEKNAEIIFTDSFHSSVFGMIFDKPFVVFKRNDGYQNMDSRLETLINKFDLKNRYYNGESITKENVCHDYKAAYEKLEKERKKSELFLKNALDKRN